MDLLFNSILLCLKAIFQQHNKNEIFRLLNMGIPNKSEIYAAPANLWAAGAG